MQYGVEVENQISLVLDDYSSNDNKQPAFRLFWHILGHTLIIYYNCFIDNTEFIAI